jgi:hypothetical protein
MSAAPSSSALHRTAGPAYTSHISSHSSSSNKLSPISDVHNPSTADTAQQNQRVSTSRPHHHHHHKQHLDLPPPVSAGSSTPTSASPVSSSSSLSLVYTTASASSHLAVSTPSPASHSEAGSPHIAVAAVASAPSTAKGGHHRFPAAMQKLALRNPATDGCGNCEEGGSCPCVDTLVNVDADEEESVGSGEVLYTEIK